MSERRKKFVEASLTAATAGSIGLLATVQILGKKEQAIHHIHCEAPKSLQGWQPNPEYKGDNLKFITKFLDAPFQDVNAGLMGPADCDSDISRADALRGVRVVVDPISDHCMAIGPSLVPESTTKYDTEVLCAIPDETSTTIII